MLHFETCYCVETICCSSQIFHLLLSELLFAVWQGLVESNIWTGASSWPQRWSARVWMRVQGAALLKCSATSVLHSQSCCCCCRMNCFLRSIWLKAGVWQLASWVCCSGLWFIQQSLLVCLSLEGGLHSQLPYLLWSWYGGLNAHFDNSTSDC